MIDLKQFRECIVQPTLLRLVPVITVSKTAENLVVGTCLHESGLTYLDQLTPGPGPAYGMAQMEKLTHDDLWHTFIPFRLGLRDKLLDIAGHDGDAFPPVEEMEGNINYAVAMCRVRYYRAFAALPAADDARALAEYWKRFYNTSLGKGTVEQALPSFQRAVAEI